MRKSFKNSINIALMILVITPLILILIGIQLHSKNLINYSTFDLLETKHHKEFILLNSIKDSIYKENYDFNEILSKTNTRDVVENFIVLNWKKERIYKYKNEKINIKKSNKKEFISENKKYYLIIYPKRKYRDLEIKILFLQNLFLFALIALILVIGLIFMKTISKKILKPLQSFSYSIDQLSKGNYDIEIPNSKYIELKRLTQNIKNMQKELKNHWIQSNEYNTARKKLIASITHDLRTPLSSIKGYVEAIEDGLAEDKETFDKYLKIISDQTNKLNSLINDLFIFTKLELNKLTYNKESINSEIFLNQYLNSKKTEFQNNQIDFLIKKPIISTSIFIDSKRILQVLENIISNAKKFTNSYIKISTTINEKYFLIHIEDDGIGITPEQEKNIFDLFYKADNSRTNLNSEGSGIGLNICQHIIEAHNGYINLKSKKNIKTIFTIALPINFKN